MELYNGDCFELLARLPDKSIDMVLTDPPYGTTNNKWDIAPDWMALWKELNRVIKDHGAMLMFSQLPVAVDMISANRKLFRYEWIWKKTNAVGFLNANRMPLRAHENILVFYKHLPMYNPQKTQGKPWKRGARPRSSDNYGYIEPHEQINLTGERHPVDVITFGKGSSSEVPHATQKPTALLEYLIKTYTNEGALVLDPFMGSGSTGVACANTGREFIGMELDEEFCNIAKSRIDEAF